MRQTVTVRPGTQLGTYEVLAAIGAGGMGVVYRARDSRLNRDVALKVIAQPLADADHLARFRREAQVLAALNHPHIASIYAFDEIDGTMFLVMELVPGDTLGELIALRGKQQPSASGARRVLSDPPRGGASPGPTSLRQGFGGPPELQRRRKGPGLQLDEALAIARQITDALEAAHEKGIVHRDLKPANIKVTPDGVVKVLDFGLAKALVSDAAKIDLSHSPTLSLGATNAGIVLGTAAYMSPEQAKGQAVDRRTDIFAFGCVLYEMLTGRPAFQGETVAEILAGVLKTEPDWSALPADLPGSMTRLLQRCLRKDLPRRLRDIGDARLEIEETLNQPAPPRSEATASPSPRAGRRKSAIWAIALLTAGGVVGALTVGSLKTQPRARVSPAGHFLIALPANERLGGIDFPAVAMAPDGSALAYVGSRGGQTQLFLRPMISLEATAIPGTTNASAPFFSPDGKWLAFFADGQLKKVPTAGGPPITLCEASVGVGGAWGSNDTIVFAAGTGSGLSRVSAGGGTPQKVTTLAADKGEFSHRWPELLPDGKTVLYTVGTLGHWDDAQIVAQSLGSDQRSVLVQGGTNPHYLASGHLIYARAGAIMAIPFDPTTLTVTGTPVRVLDNVLQSFDGAAQLSASPSGTAVYVAGEFESNRRRLAAVDRTGTATPFAAPAQPYAAPRLSPDGRKLLVTIEGATEDLWVYDVTAGTLNQVTFGAAASSPVWTPDGQRAAFSSNTGGTPNVFWASVLQPGPPERLAARDRLQVPGSWSPDGRTLAFVEQHATTGRDIWLLPIGGDRVARPFLASPADESAPRFSPDGRWIAYVSNETGANEVFVRSVASLGQTRQVSSGGGTEPVWARDGRELFYRAGEKMMAVSLAGDAGLSTTKARMLFEGQFEKGTLDAANYDVTADQRFVMLQAVQQVSTQTTLHVLVNWSRLLESVQSSTSR